MNAAQLEETSVSGGALAARTRLLSRRGEPLFYANWDNVVFIHYEAEPEKLQRCTPYPLDLYHGRAFVSLVAFTMRGMRPRFGGSLGVLFLKPIANHHFLNVRTYIKDKNEAGIYFVREWLSSRIAAWLGPCTFGLPYEFAKIHYENASEEMCRGSVEGSEGTFRYHATLATKELASSAARSVDEFLLARYTAFTKCGRRRRFFRIWHESWRKVAARVEVTADDLIAGTQPWWREAQCVGAHYSPGVDVWMGWPHLIDDAGTSSL